MRYVIQYTLPYEHRVMVGIAADNPGEALRRAESLFNQGDIWQDTSEVPLLFDGYEETDDSPLLFTVEQEMGMDEPWPEADISVKALRRQDAALRAAQLLVDAYRRGKQSSGSVDWEDLDQAHAAALIALGLPSGPSGARTGIDRDAVYTSTVL